MLKVSKSTISLYETGDTVPDAKMIVQMSRIFEVSTDYFLCQSNYRSANKEHLTVDQIGLTEGAVTGIQDLSVGHADIFPFCPQSCFNFVCAGDNFFQMMLYICYSYQMRLGSLTCDNPGEETFDLKGARYLLGTAGETGLPMEEASEFYLQRACDMLKTLVHDFPTEFDNGEALHYNYEGNYLNPLLKMFTKECNQEYYREYTRLGHEPDMKPSEDNPVFRMVRRRHKK